MVETAEENDKSRRNKGGNTSSRLKAMDSTVGTTRFIPGTSENKTNLN